VTAEKFWILRVLRNVIRERGATENLIEGDSFITLQK
jgi:hypothetical protein